MAIYFRKQPLPNETEVEVGAQSLPLLERCRYTQKHAFFFFFLITTIIKNLEPDPEPKSREYSFRKLNSVFPFCIFHSLNCPVSCIVS